MQKTGKKLYEQYMYSDNIAVSGEGDINETIKILSKHIDTIFALNEYVKEKVFA